MTLQYIYENGGIRTLLDRGLIDPSIAMYFQYNACYFKLRDEGHSYTEAISLTAITFDRSISTIKKAIRKLN